MSVVSIFYFIGLLCTVLDMSKIWANVVIWLFLSLLLIVLPFIVGISTFKRGKSLWAIKPGEEIPQLTENNDIIILSHRQS